MITKIRQSLEEKQYKETEIVVGKPELHFEPYYFFHYDALVEQTSAPLPKAGEGEEDEEELEEEALEDSDSGVESGATALHAIKKEFNEGIASLLEEFEPEVSNSKKLPKPVFSAEEIKKIASIHLSSKLHAKRPDIEISALRLVYVPFYSIPVTVESQEFAIEANAVSGELEGLDGISERGKTARELAHETLGDLKSPRAWVTYPAGIIGTVWSALYNNPSLHGLGHLILTNRRAQIALLVLIAAFVILRLYRFI